MKNYQPNTINNGIFANDKDRSKTEVLLTKEEKRFRAMVESGQDLIALIDRSFKLNYLSPNYLAVTGYSLTDLNGLLAHDLVHPDDYDMVVKEALRIKVKKKLTLPFYRFRKKDGSYMWLETTLSDFLDDEHIHAIVCNTRDVSKRKAALDEVLKLSAVVEETLNSVVISDPNGLIVWVNKAFTHRTEYTFEEAVGRSPQELLHGPETCRETVKYLIECIKNRQPFVCELVNYSKSGRKHWVEIKGHVIYDERGAVKHLFSIQMDITAKKEAEEAIRISQERYKLLFNESPTSKWIFDAETYRFVEVNDAACLLYGYSKEEFLTMKVMDIKADSERHLFDGLIQNAKGKQGQNFSGIFKHRKKSSEEFQVEINSHCIQLKTECHFIVSAYDLTERLALQHKIIEEKVAAQKEIARAIIHTQEKERSDISKELHDNINQVLTTAKLCMENTKYFPEQREMFTDKSIEMVQNAIQEIRYLSRALVAPVVSDVGLNLSILELLDQYRSLKRFEVVEELDFDEEAIDRELKITIYRIIQEQLNNAVKYAQATRVKVVVKQKDVLNVMIQDDGVGFDTGAKRKGLGLANIKNRVELFKGALEIRSAPGLGCKMTATFPF